jgi:hypothetical protein
MVRLLVSVVFLVDLVGVASGETEGVSPLRGRVPGTMNG